VGAQIISLKVGVAWSRDPYSFWYMIEHISKTTWARHCKFGTRLCVGNAQQVHKQFFPKRGRSLGHVDPTISIDFVGVRWCAPNIGRYLVSL